MLFSGCFVVGAGVKKDGSVATTALLESVTGPVITPISACPNSQTELRTSSASTETILSAVRFMLLSASLEDKDQG